MDPPRGNGGLREHHRAVTSDRPRPGLIAPGDGVGHGTWAPRHPRATLADVNISARVYWRFIEAPGGAADTALR